VDNGGTTLTGSAGNLTPNKFISFDHLNVMSRRVKSRESRNRPPPSYKDEAARKLS
jgi:hypothetical protein